MRPPATWRAPSITTGNAEEWKRIHCSIDGNTFEPRKFQYDVGEKFDWGDR